MLLNLFKPTNVKKNLLVAVIGTALAQLVHLGTTPIISRVYDPAFFGEFALFSSLLGICSTFTLLKFDLALIGADDDELPVFKKIFRKLTYSVLCILIIVFAIKIFLSGFSYAYLFLILAIIPSNEYWSNRAIQNRAGNFKRLSIGKVGENILNAVSSIVLGVLNFKEVGLLFGRLLGLLSAAFYFRPQLKPSHISEKGIFSKYQNFPKFSFPAELLIHLNLALSVFVFSYYFSAVEVGFIGLTTRVLSAPVNFISISFFDVFKQKAMTDYKETGEFFTIFMKFFSLLSLVSFLMVSTLYFYSESLFEIVFGGEWKKAGLYAKYLSILYAMRLIAGPLVYSFEITNRNYVSFIFQSLYLIGGLSSLLLSFYLFQDDILSIKIYSFSLASLYSIHLLAAMINAKRSSTKPLEN